MNIFVKYCGGCNPRYDRKKIVDRLKEDFEGINIISRLDKKICDFVVVIAGCTSACVNHDDIEGKYGKFIVKDLRDYEILKSILSAIVEK